MKLYNSLTKQKETLNPQNNTINIYSCGPTVYNFAHIGNLKAYVFMDQLYRTFEYLGYNVNSVMNITDVGHLTSDADEGDDKMLVASQREKKSPWEIAEFYTKAFMIDIDKMNITHPKHIVPATTVIPEIIEFVQGLLNKGFAYETSKGIYFNITKFDDYGALSGTKIEDKLMGARIDVDEEKKHPADFALWIKAPKNHIMQWESPWGMGYPGWHIECSAIGRKFFGDHIDIHTGGIDHKTVHHENEIAQNDCLNGKKTVDFWMHCEFMNVDNVKISKSLGNLYTLKDIEEKGFSAMCYRYFIYSTHYAKPANFSFESLKNAQNSLKQLNKLVNDHKNSPETTDMEVLNQIAAFDNEFRKEIADDINMPKALAVCWKMLKAVPKCHQAYEQFVKFNKVLGFVLTEFDANEEIPEEIISLANQRWQAKLNKDFVLADALRNALSEKGFDILDKKDGFDIIKK